MNGKCLILGANGMLGHALQIVFPEAVARGRKDLDITDEEAVYREIRPFSHGLVINAAAYTRVDDCEDHQDEAFRVNGEAPAFIAGACGEADARLVHYSTDYVFDGTGRGYVESDPPSPINVYGASKLLGEQNIIAYMDDYRIIRTSWLFGPHGRNFVDTMRGLSSRMEAVRVVDDQFGCPTYTCDLAQKTCEIAGCSPGIYHATNSGVCSWYEFARAIIPNVERCTSGEIHRKARRPACSVLLNTKTPLLRHWRSALREYLGWTGSDTPS
jgi:dTDP-4-dehydrorhamnose reductase